MDRELDSKAQGSLAAQQAMLAHLQQLYTADTIAAAIAAEIAANPRPEPDANGNVPLIVKADKPSTTASELKQSGIPDLYLISERMITQAVTDYRAIKAIGPVSAT
jgi:hypothetical protein